MSRRRAKKSAFYQALGMGTLARLPAPRLPAPLLACRSHRWHAPRAASIRGTSLALPRVADMLTVLNAERTLLSVQDQLAGSDSPPATALVAVQRAHGRRGEMTPDMADSKAL
jgi:hypothetical protein